MKKAMWIISVIPLIITMAVLKYMPDSVPMHYNISGEIDRWGSKYENLIFPAIILFFTLFWHLLIFLFEKKAVKANVEKERAEAKLNAMVLKVTAISMAVMFGILQCFILYAAYIESKANATHAAIDIGNISCILAGIMFIVLGNFMPKTKKNGIIGLRVAWSMYNDVTWMKSNRFGAVILIVTGILTIVTTFFTDSNITVAIMLVYLFASTAIMLIYAHSVYAEEVSKQQH